MGRATKEEYPQIAGAVLYTLTDPRSPSEIRYVGITRQPSQKRLNGHVCGAKKGLNTYRDRWLRTLLHDRVVPALRVVAVLEQDDLASAEVRYIRALRAVGARLTNTTDGGDGALNVPPEVKAKRSLARQRTKDLKLEQKTREYFAAVQAGTWVGPEPLEFCFPLPPMSRDEIAAWNAKNTEALKSWPKEKVKRCVA